VGSQSNGTEGAAEVATEGGSNVLAGNVADLVAAAAERGPDHPALLEPTRGLVLSWAGLDAAADAEADRLAAAGVGVGDRVLIRLGHGARFCVALFGALRVGAIAVPVGTHSTGRELAAIVVDCRPSVLVAEPGDTAVAAAVSAGGPAEAARLLAPPDPAAAGSGSAGSGSAGSGSAGAGSTGAEVTTTRRAAVGGGEDIAVLGYTSGTTGSPRGVRLSHRALLANRAQTAQLRPVPVSPADRVLLHLPLFHIYGLGAGLLQVCWSGATGVLVERVEPAAVVEVIRTERVTVLAGVPSMYRAMLELPAQQLRDALVSVRLCTAGGAPLAPELLHGFRETTGLDLFEGYGLTETGPVLTTTLVSGLAKPGSVGRPLPGGPGVAGVELRLVDAGDRPADDPAPGGANPGTDGPAPAAYEAPAPAAYEYDDPNDFGEDPDDLDDDQPDTGLVSVRGPNLFSGYWPDGAGGPDADGWFRTSDVGFVDSDGDLHLVDRANDLVIVNGFNVYPHEVEQVLNEHPSVAEAAVVGVPDPRTGEAVKAVLVLRPGTELTVEQLRAHCATRLARFKIPTVVRFADQLPHSATGKITRLALRSEDRSGAEDRA
jgi:long-chain acyl-CoA synthetase